jgi:VanZ family protein
MTARRWYALATLGVVAFTVYGSLVPFHYRGRPPGKAWHDFVWVMQNRLRVESRSDLVANVLLGVPLGFCLLGALRADRPGRAAAALTGLAVWPACVLLAASVEFIQLYFPDRTCSPTDIAAQAAGSAIGMFAWLTSGQRITDGTRRAWADPRSGGAAGRLLLAYLGLVALAQLLPLDLSISPYTILRKLRDGTATLAPFDEWTRPDGGPAPSRWGLVQTWLELLGLYLPAGLLLAQFPGRVWRGWAGLPAVAAAGLGLGLAMEAGQLLVSRHPSATDMLVGAAGLTAGWAVARLLAGRPVGAEVGLALMQAWFAVLAVIHWQPFDFAGPRWPGVNWVPFADLAAKNYLAALEDAPMKAVLFAPLGVLLAAMVRWRRAGLAAVAVGAPLAGVLEAGQVYLPGRYPSATGVLMGAVGAWAGAAAARWLRRAGAA